eukprot:scaffold19.g1754.t1
MPSPLAPAPTVLSLPAHVLAAALEALPHEELAATRLVSKGFAESAALAVRSLRLRRVQGTRLDGYPRLASLDLSEAEDWSESFLAEQLGKAPRLTRLKLGRHNTLTFVGAEALALLPRLAALDLSSSLVSDACLTRLAGRLPELRALALHECCGLSGAGLAALSSWCTLEELDLSMCWRSVCDASLEQLAGLPALAKLDLTGCERLSAAGLAALAPLAPTLRTLLLPACWQLTDGCLTAVAAALPRLGCLGLFEAGEGVGDAGLRALSSLAGSLTALDLGYSCWGHTAGGLARLLRALTGLQMLNVGGCEGGGDEVAAAIAECCTGLTQLDFSECQRLTAAGVARLGALPHLADLCLGWNLRLAEAALEGLLAQGAAALTRLDLSFCAGLGDGAARALGHLPRLASLSLRKTKVSDQGLALLAASPSLSSLDLSYTCVSPAGAAHLAALPELRELRLADCPRAASPPAMHALATCAARRLTSLDLSDNWLDDGGLQALSHIRQLRSLALRACPRISDQGLEALTRLSALRSLSLERCQQLSSAAVARLRRRLPLLTEVRGPGGGGGGWGAHPPTGRLL